MRVHGRIDANQPMIVDALRQAGCSVTSLADVGDGCPDLLIGCDGETFLAEIKTGKAAYTPLQEEWLARWRGAYPMRLSSIKEVLRFVRRVRNAVIDHARDEMP